MDFQSAARFGERRVMVTDYDETAVEVNAKVVDEDTGEVICECESGGGGTGVINATVEVTSDSTQSLNLYNTLVDASIIIDPSLSGYAVNSSDNPLEISPGNTANVIVLPGGMNFDVGAKVEVIAGEATISHLVHEGNNYDMLTIAGSCTLKVTGGK